MCISFLVVSTNCEKIAMIYLPLFASFFHQLSNEFVSNPSSYELAVGVFPIVALIHQNVKIFSSGVIFDSVLLMGGQSCNGPIGLTHLPHATPAKQFNVTYGFPFKNSIFRNNAKGRSPLEEMGMCFFSTTTTRTMTTRKATTTTTRTTRT